MAEAKTQPAEKAAPQADPKTLSPAQIAAQQHELRAPVVEPAQQIWGDIGTDGAALGGSLVVNGDPNSDYRFLEPDTYPADGRALTVARQRLMDRGYQAITGPLYKGEVVRREYVPGRSVEIWARPIDLAEEEWRADFCKRLLDERWVQIYWRRCCAEGAPERRWLPDLGPVGEALEYAVLVVHGLAKDTKRLSPTREHIVSFARRVPVHPLRTKAQTDPVRAAWATR